jgi:hypothetical protein
MHDDTWRHNDVKKKQANLILGIFPGRYILHPRHRRHPLLPLLHCLGMTCTRLHDLLVDADLIDRRLLVILRFINLKAFCSVIIAVTAGPNQWNFGCYANSIFFCILSIECLVNDVRVCCEWRWDCCQDPAHTGAAAKGAPRWSTSAALTSSSAGAKAPLAGSRRSGRTRRPVSAWARLEPESRPRRSFTCNLPRPRNHYGTLVFDCSTQIRLPM